MEVVSDTVAVALWALVVLLWLSYARLEKIMRMLERILEEREGKKS